MKPNFALILSMDGIALLKRSSPGWDLVGDVAPDDPALDSRLAELQDKLASISPDDQSCKIVVPNDQIRYLEVQPAPRDPKAQQAAVEAALDGATPYDLEDLSYDFHVVGDRIQIAAVAAETLDEANMFAQNHGFVPASFVAMPETRDYGGEPYFGHSPDLPPETRIDRDTLPIRVTGRYRDAKPTLDMPGFAEPAAPAPVAPPVAAKSDAASGPASTGTAAEADAQVSADAPGEDTEQTGTPRFSSIRKGEASAPVPATESPVARRLTVTEAESGSDFIPAPAPDAGRGNKAPAGSAVFKGLADKALGSLRGIGDGLRAKQDARRLAKEEARARKAAEEASALTLKVHAERDTAPLPAAVDADSAADQPAEDTQAGKPTKPARSSKPSKAAAPKAPAAAKKGTRGGKAGRSDPPVAASAPVPETDPAESAVVEAAGAHTARSEGLPGGMTAEQRRQEAERLTVFGQRNAGSSPRSPRYLGLILTALLLIFLAGVAAWASVFLDDRIAALISPRDEVLADDTGADAGSAETPGSGDAGSDEAEGVVLPAALPPASTTAEEEPATDSAAAEEPETPETPDAFDRLAASETNGNPVPAPDATTGVTGMASPDPAAEARYAATGIWQQSPDGPDARPEGPAEDTPGALPTIAGIGSRHPAVTLDSPARDLPPATPPPPLLPGMRFDMDDRGLVIATPEGTLSQSGVIIYASPPPLDPPTRPGTDAPETGQDDAALDPAPSEAGQSDTADTEQASLPSPADAAPADTETGTGTDVAEAAPEAVTGPSVPRIRPQPRPEALARAETGPEDSPELAEATSADEQDADEAEVAADNSDTTDAEDVILASAASLAAGGIRPVVRPGSDEPDAGTDEDRAAVAAGLAAAFSAPPAAVEPDEELTPAFAALRPKPRPGNIEALIQRAERTPEATVTQVAAAPRAIAPSIPSSASVAKQATVRNAINLNRINLIGVYGQPSSRRALVRLSNGRYQKVKVGDRVDGGRVLAIGDASLQYQKGGRNQVLEMPKG
ncbi:hypothetical protein ACRARG_01325 [Pseudooceanicola sp. C21-150M6]|uniref:hypothetical protein n=1 Tax=Pseudooceanicola sp. C21-150M6 TaxID=3434355 RepID=UPI003D7FB11D